MDDEQVVLEPRQLKYDKLPGLTIEQQKFLKIRPLVKSDYEAADIIGLTRRTVLRWKDDPVFAAEYQKCVADALAPVLQPVADAVRQELAGVVDVAVQEHVRLIQEAQSEKVRLDAIKLVYDAVGVVGSRRSVTMDVGENLRQALSALGNVYAQTLKQPIVIDLEAEYVDDEEADEE